MSSQSRYNLTDEQGEALESLRRRQPVEERDLMAGERERLRELARKHLVTRRPSMTATVRRIARTGRTPAKVIEQYRVTQQGERALTEWREEKRGRESI